MDSCFSGRLATDRYRHFSVGHEIIRPPRQFGKRPVFGPQINASVNSTAEFGWFTDSSEFDVSVRSSLSNFSSALPFRRLSLLPIDSEWLGNIKPPSSSTSLRICRSALQAIRSLRDVLHASWRHTPIADLQCSCFRSSLSQQNSKI